VLAGLPAARAPKAECRAPEALLHQAAAQTVQQLIHPDKDTPGRLRWCACVISEERLRKLSENSATHFARNLRGETHPRKTFWRFG
jgi:hypothetical protein